MFLARKIFRLRNLARWRLQPCCGSTGVGQGAPPSSTPGPTHPTLAQQPALANDRADGFSTAAAVPTLARAPRLNIGRTIAGRRTAALGHQPPEPQARCPPSPAPFWPLVPPDVFSVASGTAVPLAPGSSNKRIRSRLRAIYP